MARFLNQIRVIELIVTSSITVLPALQSEKLTQNDQNTIKA